MPFTRTDTADTNGTSLLLPITAHGPKIEELFGTFPGCRNIRAKYSASLKLTHQPTGEVFTLYMCYGAWRIGGRSEACTAIGELAELVNPCKYKGAASKTLEQLREEERAEWVAS